MPPQPGGFFVVTDSGDMISETIRIALMKWDINPRMGTGCYLVPWRPVAT